MVRELVHLCLADMEAEADCDDITHEERAVNTIAEALIKMDREITSLQVAFADLGEAYRQATNTWGRATKRA